MKFFWILILSTISVSAYSQSEYKFGLGVGLQYQGVGVSVSKVERQQLYYVSAGTNQIGGYDPSYGIGVGWLTSAPFDSRSHSVGLQVTLLNDHWSNEVIGHAFNSDEVESFQEGREWEGALAAQYVYHFSGIDRGGFQLSVGGGVRTGDHWSNTFGGFGLGYSF